MPRHLVPFSALTLVLLAAATLVFVQARADTPATTAPDTPAQANGHEVVDLEAIPGAPRDAISYALGYRMGNDLRQQDFELEVDDFAAGLRDALADNGQPRLTDEQMSDALLAFQQQMLARHQQRLDAFAAENRAFLEDNAERDDVHVTDTGLQYRVIEAGPDDAATPGPRAEVRVHYRGQLINDDVFADSRQEGQPAQFPVDGVIPGWTEALQRMTPGSKWELFIPAELAYGAHGRGNIPPHATLIFEIELLEIVE
ncbi:MAG: FKBP-type peptidyl-prolyl cis-trans isomerase [Phycisphaeraceae bacterium]